MQAGAEVKRATGAVVRAHRADRAMIETPEIMEGFMGQRLGLEGVQVDAWLEPGERLQALGREFEVRHVPGHCPGNVLFYQAAAKVALVGDALYGGRAEAGMHRQALHAFRLAFAHPVSGMPLAFHAPPPADLREALRAWGLRYNESQWLTSQADGAGSDSP